MARDKWTPETPWFGGNKKTQAVWPTYVCRNQNCKSYGKSHPNCKCGAPSFSAQSRALEYAHGGIVQFCSMARNHDEDCEHFAEGGEVGPQDDPMETVAHSAIHHGLLGLMSNVGKSGMMNPEKHTHIFEDAKTQHSERANPAGEVFKKTLGNHIGNHIADQDHEKMAEKLQDHPLTGSVGKQNLTGILKRLNQPMIDKPSHPAAFRGSVDYLHSSIRGDESLMSRLDSLIGHGGDRITPDKKARESLKEMLGKFRENPEKLLESGGDLGHYLPEHHTALSATIATAVDYLSNLEPVHKQGGPLDEPSPADPMDQAKFDRALDVAHQPLVTLSHVKDGTLIPQDVDAMKVIYPKLYQTTCQKMIERIVDAKAADRHIPYKQRLAMSLFLGEPLDATMTQAAAQAIIQSAGTQQAQRQGGGQEGPKESKPSSAELKQINKTDDLFALSTERREMNRHS